MFHLLTEYCLEGPGIEWRCMQHVSMLMHVLKMSYLLVA